MEGLFTPWWEAEGGKKKEKKNTKYCLKDRVREQQKWLSKEGMTARWKAPAQHALFNMLRQPRGLSLLSHPTPALSSTSPAFIAWCCHSTPNVTKICLTSLITIHLWPPKILADSTLCLITALQLTSLWPCAAPCLLQLPPLISDCEILKDRISTGWKWGNLSETSSFLKGREATKVMGPVQCPRCLAQDGYWENMSKQLV